VSGDLDHAGFQAPFAVAVHRVVRWV
jgi:hypothetical protein